MSPVYRLLFPALWLAWVLYWWLAAQGSKITQRKEPVGSRLLHMLPLMFAAYLLWADRIPVAFLNNRLFTWTPWQFWVAALVTAAGLGFTAWARIHLGRNWSGTVTIKQDHQLITSGPYALVRHPIYTGLLLAFLGSALAIGEWRGALAFAVAAIALWRKLRFEEHWMRQQFGDAYQSYAKRIAALVPFVL